MSREHLYPFRPFDANSDSDDDIESVASIPFSPTPSDSGSWTSYDDSMRSASPTPSLIPISSSARAQAVRQEFGRAINNYSDVYKLPADDEELQRMDMQHLIFKDVIGNYPPAMYEVMADEVPGETKTVLDLGCGSGSWSEVDDINLGLEHFYGDFDVVHAQLISSGIKDFHRLLDQITRCLKPGGLAIIIEWDFDAYSCDYRRIRLSLDEIKGPWWPRWQAFAKNAIKSNGGDVDAADNIWAWMTDHPALDKPVYDEFWMPSSDWKHEDPLMMRVGASMKDDLCAFLKSGRPLLLGSGVPEEIVDELQYNAEKELQTVATQHYIRIRRCCARKLNS
ncbi:hypothetical protein H0H92_009846 [Tricholoma furcatifolium]|nr:hypothetical protein H0H92_009846 [Tricholoma furcatifolium]